MATHKLTRNLTKDWVTIPLRAPFTEYVAAAARSTSAPAVAVCAGSIGDLLTCGAEAVRRDEHGSETHAH